MKGIINSVVSRPRPVLLVFTVLLVAGMTTYINIPKESEPDIPIPTLYVNMIHEGISPEDAERLLIRPMENELRTIEGLKEMRATAAEGSAVMILEFEPGFDADQALTDVREKVDLAKAELPSGTEEPWVQEINIALFPVLVVMLHGNVPERTLVSLARGLRDTLEGLEGVLEAEIAGNREELLEVIVDPVQLESYNLSYEELFNYVSRNNRLVAAGALDSGSGRFAIKVPGVFEGLDSLLTLPIKTDGLRTVTFQDIATVRRTYKDPTSFARLDGQRAVALEISKRIGSNIVEVVDSVRATVLEESRNWPESVQVTFTQDSSEDVRTMLKDLQNNVLTAVVLVMIVVLAALGPRSASLVGIAIPGSFLTGILVLGVLGFSINIVVLFSLIMAVGMLVDGAIVVVELADRNLHDGAGRIEAYVKAARRMSWPIIASTATTLAAFFPLLFWPGMIGEFMLYLPVTLLVTLAASLIMALLFVPTIGALIGGHTKPDSGLSELVSDDPDSLVRARGFTASYIGLLRYALDHHIKVILLAFGLLAGVFALYDLIGRGVEFFPEIEPTQAMVDIHARGDLSVYERDSLVSNVEQRILDMQEMKSIYTRSGIGFNDDIIGRVQLRFIDWKDRRPAEEILAEVRERTSDLAGIRIETQGQESGIVSGKPIQIQLSSQQPGLLDGAVTRLREGMDGISGLIDIEDNRPIPGIEWTMQIDRAQAARFGADITTVGSSIQLLTTGIMIGDYRPDDADDEVDIRVRYPYQDRNLKQFDQLRINSAMGAVPVSNFMTRVPAPRVGNIRRTDGRRVFNVNADVEEDVLSDDKVKEIQEWLEKGEIDPAVNVKFRGENEDQREAEEFLEKAFAVALFIMSIILVTQFNSFYQALLILSAVIFSTIGVLLGLLITDQPFGVVMSGIGVIALAGIVVNNNIVLIDTFNIIRKRGVEVKQAILLTCAQRLRPVLLTTITTILGLLPMVLGMNIDLIGRDIQIGAPSSQWWMQLATAVTGGLAFATMLTLMMTPCLLLFGDKAGGWIRKRNNRAVDDNPV